MGDFLGAQSWRPILHGFWHQNSMVFSLIFGCFFGVSLTCLAFRVIFVNVRFTLVKRRFVRGSVVTKYIRFIIFRILFSYLFLHAFSHGFGNPFGTDFG